MHSCRFPPCAKTFQTKSGMYRHEKAKHVVSPVVKVFECVAGHKHVSKHARRQCEYRLRVRLHGLNRMGLGYDNMLGQDAVMKACAHLVNVLQANDTNYLKLKVQNKDNEFPITVEVKLG